MLRVETYSCENPLVETAPLIPLIRSQMEAIGVPKSSEHVSRALLNAFQPGSRAVLFVGYGESGRPTAFAFGNAAAGLEAGADYFWLNELYVDPACRRQGYAEAMLANIENWLKQREIRYIALATGENNIAAQKLYAKNGYDVDGIIWVDKKL